MFFHELAQHGHTEARIGPWLDEVPPELPAHGTWERVEGMLLGLAIGDTLGNSSEGLIAAERARGCAGGGARGDTA